MFNYTSMDLRQLQVFHTVMETRSASRAARLLGVSQPAVSTLLKRIEARLGNGLFARERNRLEPTPEAVLLIAHASPALENLRKVRSVGKDHQHLRDSMVDGAAKSQFNRIRRHPIM